jgi:hypothetical protein
MQRILYFGFKESQIAARNSFAPELETDYFNIGRECVAAESLKKTCALFIFTMWSPKCIYFVTPVLCIIDFKVIQKLIQTSLPVIKCEKKCGIIYL